MMQLTTLGNGLRVASRPMASVETVAVGLYAPTGSRYESDRCNGIAHLFEHFIAGSFRTHLGPNAFAIFGTGGCKSGCRSRPGRNGYNHSGCKYAGFRFGWKSEGNPLGKINCLA